MSGLFLETWRCPDGFDLGPNEDGLPYFYSRTDRREILRLEIEDLENPVVVEFINAREDVDRIKFFTKFGTLFETLPGGAPRKADGLLRHDFVVLGVQQTFRDRLTRACSSSHVEALQAINGVIQDWPSLKPSFDLAGEGGGIRMLLKCQNLITFMDMEVAMVAMQGAKLATCEHCGDVFLTGPLTGRRSHAKYCSGRCRVAAMRARNRINSAA